MKDPFMQVFWPVLGEAVALGVALVGIAWLSATMRKKRRAKRDINNQKTLPGKG